MYLLTFLAGNLCICKIIADSLEAVSPDEDLHNIFDTLKLFWATSNWVLIKLYKQTIGPACLQILVVQFLDLYPFGNINNYKHSP